MRSIAPPTHRGDDALAGLVRRAAGAAARRQGPADSPELSTAGGRTVLVQVDREVVAELMRARRAERWDDALGALPAREHEVLALMAEGRTNAAIARELVVTPGAVEKHISNIFGRLDLPASEDDHRRVLAVLAEGRRRLRPLAAQAAWDSRAEPG